MRMPKQHRLLLALSVFFVGTTAAWLALNRAPPNWDDSWYLTNSLVMFDALSNGGIVGYAATYLSILRSKPPLITVLPTPLYLVLGRNPHAAYLVNLVAMLVLFFSLYGFARRIGNRTTGYIALFVAGTMPLLYGLSRWFLVDYSLTALVCLAIYLTIKALESPRIETFFLLGITCGLGVLLKITFPAYVFLPVLYLVIHMLRNSRRVRAQFAALFGPALLLALPWYSVNYRDAISRAVFSGYSAETQAIFGTGAVFSVSAISTYLLSLVNFAASGYYSLLAIALLATLCFTREIRVWFLTWPKQVRHVLLLWAVPFAVFLFGPNKDLRFAAPFLPLLALFIASGLDHTLAMMTHSKRAILTAVVLAFPLVAFLHTSFGVLGNGSWKASGVIFAARDLHFATLYQRQRWPHREILNRIVQAARAAGLEKSLVMLASDLPEFNMNNFELTAVRYGLPLEITTSAYENNPAALISNLRTAKFVLYKDGGNLEPGGYNRLRQIVIKEIRGGENFREIPFGLILPHGGVTRIFENVSFPGRLTEAALIRHDPGQVNTFRCDFGGQIELTGLMFEQTQGCLRVRLR